MTEYFEKVDGYVTSEKVTAMDLIQASRRFQEEANVHGVFFSYEQAIDVLLRMRHNHILQRQDETLVGLELNSRSKPK